MSNDFLTNPITTTNYELVRDVETYKCVVNVGSCAKFEQTCSKHRLFHLWFYDSGEIYSSQSLQPLYGPEETFLTWLVLEFFGEVKI
jgi:hypothetical protein